jgi:iron complex outermembrane recepter protein
LYFQGICENHFHLSNLCPIQARRAIQIQFSMKRTNCLIVAILGLMPLLAFAQKDCHAMLFGTVTEADTEEPVLFAEVFIVETGRGAVTDDKGNFVFTELCEGKYTVTCQHIGCSHLSKEIVLVGEMNLCFHLQHESLNLTEITVHEKAVVLPNTQAERSLEGSKLDAGKGQTMGDMLKLLPGVTTLNTGSGISKPVIRGMHSNRVLMLNNGVRQEGQQWGSEHAPEIDPYIADRVTVVYGANSVRYGADAMGGVVVVEPRALRSEPGMGGELNLAAFGNGRVGVASAMLDGKLKGKLPLSGRIQGTFKRGGDLRTSDYFLKNTGVKEINYSAAIGLERERWTSEVFFSQFFTDIGVYRGSHIGNLTDLENAIERGRPTEDGSFSYHLGRPLQRVAHYLLKAKTTLKTGTAGKFSLQYARQFNRRGEFDAHKRYGTLPSELDDPEMLFEITTHTLDLGWEHKSWRHFTGSMGTQGMAQRNTTDRGGLIPNYNSQTAGVFWIERWRKHPFPVEFEAGVRYDLRHLDVQNRGNEVIDKRLDFSNLSGTAGVVYKLAKHFDIKLHWGSAWRAPNVNELFSDGVHHGSASYEKGRSDLVPERAHSTNLTFDFDNERNLSFNFSLYRNLVQDFIYLLPQAEPVLTIRGAFPSFAYEQADARLKGLDWSAAWKPIAAVSISSGASLLRAWNKRDDEWLALMPADRFRFGIGFSPKAKKAGVAEGEAPYLKLGMEHVLRQSRVPDSYIDFAPAPKAFTLINMEAGFGFTVGRQPSTVKLSFAIQNLLNTAYRDYLNRLRYFAHETGRNVSVRAKFSF